MCQSASNCFHFFGGLRAVFTLLEALRIVAGFEGFAVMGDAVEQGGGHLRIAKYLHSLTERQVRGDDQRGTARCRKRQISQFIQNDRIHQVKLSGKISNPSQALFTFQLIDQIDCIEEAHAFIRSRDLLPCLQPVASMELSIRRTSTFFGLVISRGKEPALNRRVASQSLVFSSLLTRCKTSHFSEAP